MADGNLLLMTGILVSLTSVLGLIHLCCTTPSMLVFHMIYMIFMICFLTFNAFFVFLVTNIHSADKFLSANTAPGLRDDSMLLRDHLRAEEVWLHFKNYLVDVQFCKSLASNHEFPEFFYHNISPLQGVCCMPPSECGFEHKNGTLMWTGAIRKGEKNKDCGRWSNKQNELCLNCDTCKAGFLPVFRKQWRSLGFLFLALLAFTIIIWITSCPARGEARIHNLEV
ncbi:hypothetical protein M5689_004142 [Euphorbia peplus]|nr:hypothetical protein M5689_004142 [Euphorbia peplus]